MSDYTPRLVTTEAGFAALAEAWERCRRARPRPHLEQHLDWLAAEARWGLPPGGAPAAVALTSGEALVGGAAFLLQPWQWPCRLGYRTVARFPLRLAHLAGEGFLGPDDPEAHEALLVALAEAPFGCQVVFLESIPLASPLLGTLEKSRALRRRFRIYRPAGVTPHWFIRLPERMEAYVDGFRPKTWRNLRQGVQKLERNCPGGMFVDRITRREQLPAFLEQAERISRASWQGSQLGKVLRNTEAERNRLGYYADRGWLRSYLLRNGGEGIGFGIGLQADGTYYYNQTGYLPAWRALRPGKALLIKMLEDLFRAERPDWFDFRYGDSELKRLFGNHSSPETNLYLVRRSAYPTLALCAQAGCARLSAAARAGLDRLGLRERVRRRLRGGEPGDPPSSRGERGEEGGKKVA